MEVDAIMKQLGRSVPDDTQILFGLAVDPKLGDSLSVTLISSLGLEQMNRRPVASEEAAIAPAPVFKPVAEVKKTPEVKKAPPLPAPVPVAAVEPEPLELFIAPPPPPAPETPAPSVEELEPVGEQESEIEESVEEIAAISEPETPKKEEVESPFAFAEQTPIITPIAQTAKVIAPIRNRQPEAAPEVARSVLAAVLANPAAAAVHESPVDHVIEEELMEEPLNSSARSSAPVLVGAGAAAKGEQQTFRLGDEDRGRFKDTEPSISDGEDLDVPTWMRMRKKSKG